MVRIVASIVLFALGLLVWASSRVEAPGDRAYSAFSPDPTRQFDFLIGEWDIQLRLLRGDGILDEPATRHASVYSILDGKAIVDLWDTAALGGLGVRYFDSVKKRWVLWLYRAAANQQQMERLEGSFRHGRGEFHQFSSHREAATITSLQAYSDITPFSFRWDSAESGDAGKSWTMKRVMEFTRTETDPRQPITRAYIPTVDADPHCDDDRFRFYELLVGMWRNEECSLEIVSILDRCAILGYLESVLGTDEAIFVTFDPLADRWVWAVLDSVPGTGLLLYTSSNSWTDLVAESGDSLRIAVSGRAGGLREPGAKLYYYRAGREIKLERVQPQNPAR